jgi:hypothetical protein
MGVPTSPTKAEPAAVTTRHGLLSLFHDDNSETRDVYYIQTPGVQPV